MAELLEDRAYDYGCNSGTPLRDAVGSLKKKELIRLWNSILPEPGQPCQLSKLIRSTECRKTLRSMSRWHRTVRIPWLVDSYDTHKGKRWLNSNPQTTGQKRTALFIWRTVALPGWCSGWCEQCRCSLNKPCTMWTVSVFTEHDPHGLNSLRSELLYVQNLELMRQFCTACMKLVRQCRSSSNIPFYLIFLCRLYTTVTTLVPICAQANVHPSIRTAI